MTAYALARRGKKVVVLPEYGLDAPQPQGSARMPLKLSDVSPDLAHLSMESASYWGGLELQATKRLLQLCPTLDVIADEGADHPASQAFSTMLDSCRAAGVRGAKLSGDEAAAHFRRMQMPAGSAALLQPDGAVLYAREAVAAVAALAPRIGVSVKERLQLRGWWDAGGFFRLRASSLLLPSLESVFEAEQLVLAPDAWPSASLRLFGLTAQLQDRQTAFVTWRAGSEAGGLPIWNYLGGGGGAWRGLQPCYGFPVLSEGGPLAVMQLPCQGRLLEGPGGRWAPAPPAPGAQTPARGGSGGGGRGGGEDAAAAPVAGAELLALHAAASALVKGMPGGCSDLTAGADDGVAAALNADATPYQRTQFQACSPDGRPLLGYHPGFEGGRVLVVVAAAGAQLHGPGAMPGFQHSPVLAKLATEQLLGAPPEGSAPILETLSLGRPALEVDAGALAGMDSWERLAALQAPEGPSREEVERRADEAEDRRQQERGDEREPGAPRAVGASGGASVPLGGAS